MESGGAGRQPHGGREHRARDNARWARGRALGPAPACILLLAALGCGGARPATPLPDARDFDPGEKAVVDEAYRFRLAAPGERWMLLDGPNAQAMVPDARAVAFLPGAHVVVQVLVERADEMSLEDFAELHAETLKLRAATRSVERMQHQGRDGLKLGGVRIDDGALDVRSLVLRHERHVYELRVIAPRGGAPSPAIDSLFDAAVRRFSLLSGAVRPPPPAVAVQLAMRGPGWRVRDGVFESIGSALRVGPPPGWRLVVGSELEELNPDAEVGLQRADPPLFVTVVPERVDERDLEALRKKVSSQVAVVEGGERHTLRWDGKPLQVAQIRPEGFPESIAVLFGTRFQRGRHYQIVIGRSTPDGLQHMQSALDALGFLEPAAEQALARELSALPDPQAMLVGEHALWGGRFRDFERGITWVKPDPEWAAHIGSVATAKAQGASLVFEHGRHGLIGYLLPFDDIEGDARSLLRAFLSGLVSEGRAQQMPIDSLQLVADSSATCETDVMVEGLPFRFAMASAVTGKRGVVLVVSGFPENMRKADAEVKSALGGLEVSRTPLQKQSMTEGVFTSWRYGIKFTPPPGSTWTGPQELQRGGVEVFIWSTPEQVIALAAMARRGIADRGYHTLRIVMEQQLKAFGAGVGATPAMSPHTLAGRPGHRMSVDSDEMRGDVFAANRGDHAYVLTVFQKGPNRSAQRADAAAAGFELLD